MADEPLQSRKHILRQLGFHSNASRASWSHDSGDSIVFDAWDHQWERDAAGAPLRYPLRTASSGYSYQDSIENPRQGHTRWQKHVDLVLSGKRRPRAILPVANDPSSRPNKGAQGWRPVVIDGRIARDEHGDIWLVASRFTQLPPASLR